MSPVTDTGPGGWVTGLTLAEAQDLLDRLENLGVTGLEIDYRGSAGFAVRPRQADVSRQRE
jgi:hypothetical protein